MAMHARSDPANGIRIAADVTLGKNVGIYCFVNLYGCRIGDDTRIGAFVEIQKNAVIGSRCKISSHTFICEGVTIEDEVFVGHGVMFINDPLPRAAKDGQLLTDAEYLCFEGDSTVVPTEFDGIKAQLIDGVASGQVDPGSVLDARANSLMSVNLVNQAAASISKYGNFGTPTDLFCSQLVQADFDTGLDPAFRVPLADVPGGGIRLGSPVAGVRTSWGNVEMNPDVFIRDEWQKAPFENSFPAVAASQVGLKPTAVAVAAAANAASLFTAAQAGNYYYYVTGVNAAGQSTGLVTAQVAVSAGEAATLTITRSAAGQETGYVIYRSRLNGGNAVSGVPVILSEFREMARIASAGATTTYVDVNGDIPGTTNAFVLNLNPGATALLWRQLLPMIKFPLYPTNQAVIPWAQLLFGYLRISKRRHHVVIKNIVTNGQAWQPFSLTVNA